MKIAVLGTGMVGRALAARLAELGHSVTVGTRDPESTLSRADDASYGDWAAAHPDIVTAPFPEAAAGAELVVNASNGTAALDVLALAGEGNLAGKVVADLSNPLDFSHGFPPTLLVKDTDSLGEQIQRAFPEARVVKTLNTLNADLMVRPDTLPEPTTVFVSGNDADAKRIVTDLLQSFGHTDVIDLGDITTARGAEMFLPLWLSLMGVLGTTHFNLKIIR